MCVVSISVVRLLENLTTLRYLQSLFHIDDTSDMGNILGEVWPFYISKLYESSDKIFN